MFGGGDGDYDMNSYGGTQINQGHGGGFLDSDNMATGTNDLDSSTQTPVKRKYAEEQSLLPVTIQQIKNAPLPERDEIPTIDGKELHTVTIIGRICHIDMQSTHTSYTIDDCTGQIDVKVWSSDGDTKQQDFSDLKEEIYVRVIGRMQIFRDTRSITGFQLIPIQDYNELTTHLLETIHAHLINTMPNLNKQQLNFNNDNNNNSINNQAGQKQTQMNSMANTNNNNNTNNMNMNNNANAGMTSLQMDGWDQYTSLQKKMLLFINRPDEGGSDEGCHINRLFGELSSEDRNDIREALEELASSGAVYTTIDEEHYKLASQ